MAKSIIVLVATFAIFFFLTTVRARDPELLTDFAIPDGTDPSTLNGTFFTYTGLRGGVPSPAVGGAAVLPVKLGQFPPLNGMGISIELIAFGPSGSSAQNIHPRGSAILYLLEGSLFVSMVDGTGKVYQNMLQTGDVFLIPKGLPHVLNNTDHTNKAVLLLSYGSADAGNIIITDI